MECAKIEAHFKPKLASQPFDETCMK